MDIEVAHRAGFTADLFEQLHGRDGAAAGGFAGIAGGSFPEDVLEGGLEAAGSGARVVDRVDAGIVRALREVLAQFSGQPPDILEVMGHECAPAAVPNASGL